MEATAKTAPTKLVTVFVGSAHRGGATQEAARRFLDRLQSFGDIRTEIVLLGEHASASAEVARCVLCAGRSSAL